MVFLCFYFNLCCLSPTKIIIEGSGKTVVINSVMKKLKEDERQDIRFIILNFEEYFKIPMNLVKDNEPPPVLDDFLTFFQDWFQPKLYNFLIATLDDTVDLISPLEVYDILTESTCIRYSLKQDIIESKIIDHLNKKKDGQSLDFMKEFQSFSSNLWGYSPRKLFQLYCNELSDMSTISNHHESALQEKVAKENYNQSPLAIAFKLAFKFLNKTYLSGSSIFFIWRFC